MCLFFSSQIKRLLSSRLLREIYYKEICFAEKILISNRRWLELFERVDINVILNYNKKCFRPLILSLNSKNFEFPNRG